MLRPYDLYILVISALSLAILAADALLPTGARVHELLDRCDLGLCVLFFADFLRDLRLSPNRKQYLLRNGWLDVASSIPTIGLLRLGRVARIVRVVRLFRAMRSAREIGQVIARHRVESALAAAAVVAILLTTFGSIAVLQFEQAPDSNIRTPGDALWWAFATITTVGYGDRYPVTLEGRLVAAMLMAAGVGLFGALSGLIASWFLHGDSKPETDDIGQLRLEVARLAALLEEHNRLIVRGPPSVFDPARTLPVE